MFGVTNIPSDTQIRTVLNGIDSENLIKINRLQRGNHLKKYEIEGKLLTLLDGTQFFSSNTVNYKCCLRKEYKNGITNYSHQALQAVIANPNIKQILPLCAEEIRNEDGTEKQDCEINAGKRLLKKLKNSHPKMSLIICGDDLYSRQPMIEKILENKWVTSMEVTDENVETIVEAARTRWKIENEC